MDSISVTTPMPTMRGDLNQCAAMNGAHTARTNGDLPKAVMPSCQPQKWLLGQKALVTARPRDRPSARSRRRAPLRSPVPRRFEALRGGRTNTAGFRIPELMPLAH
jgi:hypothetical protein